MSSITSKLIKKSLIYPPKFVSDNICYETIMGSVAYGVSSDDSDIDIYGWCIPPKEVIFPHLNGEIIGFGRQKKSFEQFQQSHIKDDSNKNKPKEYDITIYNIVKYFNLCMENNPNMIDSLFVDREHVIYINKIGEMIREKRRIFLHKGCWFKLKGYAYSQLHKIKNGRNAEGKRKDIIEKYGYDTKFGYHVVRLLGQCEQILIEGDLDLKRNNEHLKAIRRGEVSLEDIERWFSEKEKQLEKVYNESTLRYSPDEKQIKQLLLNCLEEHYGSLSSLVPKEDGVFREAMMNIKSIVDECCY